MTKTEKNGYILFVLLLLILQSAVAGDLGGFVYKVSSDQNSLYLVGSIHLLREQDYPLPKPIDEAYSHAGRLIMELDPDDQNPMTVATLMTRLGRAPEGSDLATIMGPDAWLRSKASASDAGIDLDAFMPYRPWLAALLAIQVAWINHGYDRDKGVETYFEARAKQDGKTIDGLETLEQQLRFFADLSDSEQTEFLEQAMIEIKTVDRDLSQILNAWKTGNDSELYQILGKSYQEYPGLFEIIIDRRNQDWLVQLEKILESGDKNVMVIVGAMHLLGDQGLVSLFEQRGYEIERL